MVIRAPGENASITAFASCRCTAAPVCTSSCETAALVRPVVSCAANGPHVSDSASHNNVLVNGISFLCGWIKSI